jgi:L-aminopeptidase/D-esterase-like protein
VDAALDALAATGGMPEPVQEGNVGGGTGMICHDFKGGIGTALRRLPADAGGFIVGVLVQANHGLRSTLTIAGVPVGREIPDLLPELDESPPSGSSITVVVGTDAPLLPHQLDRLARRSALGVGVVGGRGDDFSGDLCVTFSTAARYRSQPATDPDGRNGDDRPHRRLALRRGASHRRDDDRDRRQRRSRHPHQCLQEVLDRYNRLDQ